jgi:hypothetical protein
MRTHLVCFATRAFERSQQRLAASALRAGVEQVHCWNRERLEATRFYHTNRCLLDHPRGAGYWVWKPFIIRETMDLADPGDLIIYADSGIEIVGDLAPLSRLCLQKGGILLFDGPYDDVGRPGPNICRKWVRRDCFVNMGCDTPEYHDARVLDASFLVLAKNERAELLISEWLNACCQPAIVRDGPNLCGLDNLPEFLGPRYDQAVLSLLAVRFGLEIFRHPGQHGNYQKQEHLRQPGEFLRLPYGSYVVHGNSPYGTLLNHHRERGARKG